MAEWLACLTSDSKVAGSNPLTIGSFLYFTTTPYNEGNKAKCIKLVGESFELGEQNILSTISTGQSKCVVALATTM